MEYFEHMMFFPFKSGRQQLEFHLIYKMRENHEIAGLYFPFLFYS